MSQTVGEYLGKTKPPVINQHAVSNEYRDRFGETFEQGEITHAYVYEHARDGESLSDARARLEMERIGEKCSCGHRVHDSHGRCMESVATGMVDDSYTYERCPCGKTP